MDWLVDTLLAIIVGLLLDTIRMVISRFGSKGHGGNDKDNRNQEKEHSVDIEPDSDG